jgi:hypothetical protein
MANTVIQLRNSTVTGNVPSSLANGEISINSRDGKFFYSTPAGSVITHYPYLGPSGLDTEIQFNDSGTIGGSEKLTFNKTTGQLTVNGTVRANIFSADGVNVYAYAINSFNAANAAFTAANGATATNTTQNNSITAAFNSANSAFIRANNSLDANNGGTITGNVTITTNLSVSNLTITNTLIATTANLTVNTITTGSGVGGIIAGANVIYSNVFVANSGGYVQFSDGSKQYTANAGSGSATDSWARNQANAAFTQANTGGSSTDSWSRNQANAAFTQANTAQSTASSAAGAASSAQSTADAAYNTNDFAVVYTPNNSTSITASSRRDTFNIVGESGIIAYANATTKTVTIAGTPGAQGLTVDYGFVYDSIYYSIDYGTL